MFDLVDRIEDAIGSLADETTELGIFAEEVFKSAAAALFEQPEEAARVALETERVCQHVYRQIHQKGLAILAWYQPTVEDMRRVIELQYIAAELARIGVDGRHLAEQALWLRGRAEAELRAVEGPASLLLEYLIRHAYNELRGCVMLTTKLTMMLTTTRDDGLARRLLTADRELDRIFLSYKAMLDEAILLRPRSAATLQRLLLLGVYMRDIGKHVVAICRALLFEPPTSP